MKIFVANQDIPMALGVLTIYLHLPGCRSLKEKRGLLSPIIARIQKDYKASVAEIGYQDKWTESVIACAYLSNSANHAQSVLTKICQQIEGLFPYANIIDTHIDYV